jgi:pimeloyl-ACP methyl ester carboxylesterase
MEFTEVVERSGVLQRQFTSRRASRSIPGVLWTPSGGRRGPLVLLGHGGSGSVFDDHIVALARGLVRDEGCICVAIDGPVHGRRRGARSEEAGLVLLDFSQVWASDPAMTDDMVADWRSVLDELVADLELDGVPVGYWGLSMGTILGLPLVAAEPRITAAVLGLCGLTGPTRQRLGEDAARVGCPVFFVVQLEDELFDRESSLALFDALFCVDKQLHATPGRHGAVTAETFSLSARFLLRRLAS